VIFGRDVVVADPTPDKVARLLGLNLDFKDDESVEVLIVGGPAGVAAGVYAGAEGLSALVAEDVAIGGQATSLPGIFAVGDVRAGSVKRVASSVGEGSVVISKVWEFVNRTR
jgi:thioredoxin reductase